MTIQGRLCAFSQSPYYRCALLVARNVVRLRDEAEHLAMACSWPMISLGGGLAERLSPFAPSRRARQVIRALGSIRGCEGEQDSIIQVTIANDTICNNTILTQPR